MKPLKTKNKEIFKTADEAELLAKVAEMKLTAPSKPYIYTHVQMSDEQGNTFAIFEHVVIGSDKKEIIVSPEKVWQLLTA